MNDESKKMFNLIKGGEIDAIILSALIISTLLVVRDALKEIVKEQKFKEECLKKGSQVSD